MKESPSSFSRSIVIFGILLMTIFTALAYGTGQLDSLRGQVITSTSEVAITLEEAESVIQGHLDEIAKITTAAQVECPDYDALMQQLSEIRSSSENLLTRINIEIPDFFSLIDSMIQRFELSQAVRSENC